MFLRIIYFLFSLLIIFNLRPALNNSDLLLLMRQQNIPIRKDGKIEIPSDIKHIKLDIGLSYSAPMSQYWLTHEDNLLIFGFEPNPLCVTSILQGATKKAESHGVPLEKKFIGKNFFLIPCALGLSSNNIMKFYITANDWGCSSIFFPKDFPIQSITHVSMFTLSDFFDLFPFDTHPVIDYIKIDAQGSDLNIVKSAGHYLTERVIYITLEAENSQYQNTLNSEQDIEKYMSSVGFIRHISSSTSDPTYFNSRYSEYIKNHNIQIYQKG